MHKDLDINIKNLSKIEGHTHLDVKVRNKKVVECKLKVSENKRFFRQAILGKNFREVPFIMSRICGTCSSAHLLCSIEAIEKALGLKVTEQTNLLRNLLINAGHLRDHAMHLYFFCLPDLFKKDSVLDFSNEGEEHELIHDGLYVKETGNFLSTVIGGRAVHPFNAVIGGFLNFPSSEEIREAIERLKKSRKKILRLIDLFHNQKEKFERETNFVALVNNDYNFLKGFIKTSKGSLIKEEEYGEHFHRVVLPYSTATAFVWESKEYMVGALARINLNKENLNKNTKKDAESYIKVFPSNNIFYNNLAQSIEMLNEVDNSIDILEKINLKKEKPIEVEIKEGLGIGVIEAPRGTLYYHLELNKYGIVNNIDLCIPTQQNIIHIEKSISEYIEKILDKDKKEISLSVEKLIRAYDPCMSCATHFLKINWV